MTCQSTIEKTQAPQSVVATAEPTRSGRTYLPTVDIVEKPDEIVLHADVPGANPEKIDIQFENGMLTICAAIERQQESPKSGYLLREYGIGDFCRSFRIGEGIDASKISAEVRNGVLTLHLPKSESVKSKKIAVKAE